jgi:hypothetical protein
MTPRAKSSLNELDGLSSSRRRPGPMSAIDTGLRRYDADKTSDPKSFRTETLGSSEVPRVISGRPAALGTWAVISFGQSSLTNTLGQHQQITIRVLDKDLLLTGLAIARFAPDLAWTEADRPILASEIGQNRAYILEVNLKHRTLPKRRLHRSCLESAITLAEHDLLAFRMLQVNKLFRFTPIGNFKADGVLPESEADVQVGNMELRYHFGPARF